MPDTDVTRRIKWLDHAKGIAIILVVFSHVIGSLENAGRVSATGVFAYLNFATYTFHVPVFFFLAGLFAARDLARDRGTFWRGKIMGLLVPYIAWSALYVIAALTFRDAVNRPIDLSMLFRIVWDPYLQFWFLYALILAHAIAYVLLPLGRAALFGCALAMYALGFLLEREGIAQAEMHFFIYYACGLAMADARPIVTGRLSRIGMTFLLLLPATAIPFLAGLSYQAPASLPATAIGVILVLRVAHWLGGTDMLPSLRLIGARSMPIYVLHVFFVSATRIGLDRIGLDSMGMDHVVVQVLAGTVIGVAGPLLFYSVLDRAGLAGFAAIGAPKRRVRPAVNPVAQVNGS